MTSTTAPAKPTLASFWHDLPREGRLLLSVVVLGVHRHRPGAALPCRLPPRGPRLRARARRAARPAAAGRVPVVGPGGSAIDRLGARPILMGAPTLQVAANTLLAFAGTEAAAAVALLLSGRRSG